MLFTLIQAVNLNASPHAQAAEMFSLFSFPMIHELLMPTVQISVHVTALEQCIAFGEQYHTHMLCVHQ